MQDPTITTALTVGQLIKVLRYYNPNLKLFGTESVIPGIDIRCSDAIVGDNVENIVIFEGK
jgi:hypothetical protein